MSVFLELAHGDTLMIGSTRIVMERKSGQRARLKIDSTEDIERIKAGQPVPTAAKQAAAGINPGGGDSTPRPFLQRRLPQQA